MPLKIAASNLYKKPEICGFIPVSLITRLQGFKPLLVQLCSRSINMTKLFKRFQKVQIILNLGSFPTLPIQLPQKLHTLFSAEA